MERDTNSSNSSGAPTARSAQIANLIITDATAVFAWCESADEAAGVWLCAKYRPFILHIAARHFRDHEAQQQAADETLRRALSAMPEHAPAQTASWFARVAVQVCLERAREVASAFAATALAA